MVLNFDLNNLPQLEDDVMADNSINVSTDLELGRSQIEIPALNNGDDVVICSRRSFEEARNNYRRNRRVRNLHDEDAGSQRNQSAMSADAGNRQRRTSRRRNVSGNQLLSSECCDDIEKGKGNSMPHEVSHQFTPPPRVATFICPICMAPFNEETSTKCGHIFCKKCIAAAITRQGKCPTCRRKLKVKDTLRIYLPKSC